MTDHRSHIPLYKNLPSEELHEKINFHVLNAPSDYDTSEAHRHGYHELFFFDRGGGSHTIDFKENKILSNSVHLVSNGQVHQLNRDLTCQGLFLTFSQFTLSSYLSEVKIQEFSFLDGINQFCPVQLPISDYNKLSQYATNIKNSNNQDVRFSWLLVILNILNETFQRSIKESQSQDDLVSLFCIILGQNYHLHHAPSYYADRLAVSEKQLNARIKKSYGITVSEMIAKRLLLEAKRLIIYSSLSFKEISFDLGFNDPAYFSRFIKKNVGISPSRLRFAK